jgi:hypothetical protein
VLSPSYSSFHAYRIVVGNPERPRTNERPKLRSQNNIKMDLKQIKYESVDWIHLAQDRDRCRALANSNEPSGSIEGGKFFEQLSDF